THDGSSAEDDFAAQDGGGQASEHAGDQASDAGVEAPATDDSATDETPAEDDASPSLRDAVAGLWTPRLAGTAGADAADGVREDESASQDDEAP
ncbi:hypothetical protein, partial [Polaribacter sargassicola]|uniref:hypothetical protein n=1 Tax=Polaribacter sargassicola TaxID=2836891 RepID=UPI001F40434D